MRYIDGPRIGTNSFRTVSGTNSRRKVFGGANGVNQRQAAPQTDKGGEHYFIY